MEMGYFTHWVCAIRHSFYSFHILVNIFISIIGAITCAQLINQSHVFRIWEERAQHANPTQTALEVEWTWVVWTVKQQLFQCPFTAGNEYCAVCAISSINKFSLIRIIKLLNHTQIMKHYNSICQRRTAHNGSGVFGVSQWYSFTLIVLGDQHE